LTAAAVAGGENARNVGREFAVLRFGVGARVALDAEVGSIQGRVC